MKKYLRQSVKSTLQWLMNPVPTVYPQKGLSKPSSLPIQQTTRSLPRKRSFSDEFSTFQQLDITITFQDLSIIRTFQDLNELIAPAGFQFKELDNCIIFPFSFWRWEQVSGNIRIY